MPTWPAVVVARDVAVDAVGHAALLAHLLHEPRGSRPAEHVVEQREREAAIVVARQPGRRQADVVLLGVAREEELLPADDHGGRRAHGALGGAELQSLGDERAKARRARRCPPPRRRRSRRRSACRDTPRCRRFVSARTVAAVPITGRPSSWSPNTPRAARSCTRSDGSSSIIAISSSTTSRSDSSASASKRGRAAMSHMTSSASGRCSSSTRTCTTVDSRVV